MAQIERKPVDALIPYIRNARTHTDAQIAQIAASIREFGWTNPILLDGANGVIAGHGRLLAARQLGMTDVPCIELAHLTEAQRRAYVIADNQLAANAGWNDDLLRVEIGDLDAAGFDLSLLGFDDGALEALLAPTGTQGLTDPDEAPAAPETPVSVLGDVWLLGRHRLVCGDCTDPLVVDKALAGVKPHLMVTDPPYGVEYDPKWRQDAGLNLPSAASGRVLNDDRADWREAWALFPGDVVYVWHSGLRTPEVMASLDACRFRVRAQIVWVKTRPLISRGHYHWQHEPALYGVREGADDQWRFVPEHEVALYAVKKDATGHWNGSRKQSTVWFIEHLKSDTGHGTQKPVECMRRPIENNSSPGQAVYEPFSGSGTTIIAAEMTGRICHAIELNQAYIDVAIQRWQNFTGQQATLDGDGRTFEDVAKHRAPLAEAA